MVLPWLPVTLTLMLLCDDLVDSLRKQLEKSAQRELAKNPSLVADQANLPTLQDPRLWMIMCKVGHKPQLAAPPHMCACS